MRKTMPLLLTFIIIFSLFSDILVVNAAGVTDMRFVRTKVVGQPEADVLYIYGSGFSKPVVAAGATGSIPVKINETLSNSYVIVIDDPNELSIMKGIVNRIRIYNDGTTEITDGDEYLNLTSIPTITSVSKNKAYVGESLSIDGLQIDGLNAADDKLYVAGTEYSLGEVSIAGNSIFVDSVKSPNDYGVSDIKITKRVSAPEDIIPNGPKYEITSVLADCITVVSKISGITVERIDPNAGPKDKKNIVSIYGTSTASNFRSDMRIFVEGVEGRNLGTIIDSTGKVIGLKCELPTRASAGTVDITITTSDLSSDLVIQSAFVYLDIGNTLTIDPDGINPNFKTETEQKIIQIKGRNIGFFNGTGYDKISGVTPLEISEDYPPPAGTVIGYAPYGSFTSRAYYKLKYSGLYDDTTNVTIIRQFRVTIDGDAEVAATEPNSFTLSKDIIYVKPADVNLDPNEPKNVDVSIETITTIIRDSDGYQIYNRTEKYTVKDGFTYLPDEVTPAITSVTPAYGPSDKEIYMTIRGTSFQVKEDGEMPRVIIGERELQVTGVYDDQNRVIDGKILTLGTKIKCRLPAGNTISGAANVVVINPSDGQKTLVNGFEFRNPSRDPLKMPAITQVKENFADIRGGEISGETSAITGSNFDTSADDIPRVLVTIDGEKASLIGKVSSDGKTMTIIPPPGTIPGMTMLQVINEDGSMASFSFEYRLITSNPKITSIVPTKGGNGIKLIIKGEDFVLPDDTVEYKDPKRKGSVVLLGGMELNAYKYNQEGEITDVDPNSPDPLDPGARTNSIYYDDYYDPDGSGPLPAYYLNGHMIRVQDITTIYVDIPDRFYKFAGEGSSAPYLQSQVIPLGELKVEVLNPDGAKSKEDVRFTYMNPSTKPVIADISPNSGSVDGGTVVTITGSGFKKDNLEIYFGSEKSQKVDFISSATVRALVPEYPYPLPNGSLKVPVIVLNYDGGSAVSYDDSPDDGFTYRVPGSHPVISSITPDTGSAAGKDRVVIRGLDFRRNPDMSGDGLPKVYFGGEEAEVEWPAGNDTTITETLTVTTPRSLVSGPVDVVLVNYDSGTCTFKSFTYTKSQPRIDSITPDIISNLGNVNVQINGSGFREGNLDGLFALSGNLEERVDRHTTSSVEAKAAVETIVAFGDEAEGDKKTIDTVLGPPYTVIGDLRFDCDATTPGVYGITVSKASDPTHAAIMRYYLDENGDKKPDTPAQATISIGSSHMFIINHMMDLGSSVSYDEGILVETTPSSVTITRRMAPYAKIQYDGTQLTVKSPPIDRIGTRNVYAVNDDGGTAFGEIRIVSPDSHPVITDISPKNRAKLGDEIVEYDPNAHNTYSTTYTFVPLDGGAFITITGADFRRNVKAYLNDRLLEIVSKSINDNQLIVKVPPGTEADVEKDYRITVVNEDGGTFDSTMLAIPHYIRYQLQQSEPVIEAIVPDRSSSRGDNTIAIYGNNFRLGVKVFIEGVEAVTTRDAAKPYGLISVRVPAGLAPGKKTVQVQNPDFGFCELRDGLTIVSSPEITGIFDEEGDEIDPLVLTVEGGESIRLQGIQFYEGARVIVGGTLKPKSELKPGETGIEVLSINNAEMVVVGGTQASDAKVVNESTITFTTPKLSVGATSIIVVNSDGGVSNEVTGAYQKPVPDSPGGISAEVVDGDTIKLEWDKVEDVNYYEIYVSVSEDGKKASTGYEYLGSIVPAEISETRVRYYLDGLLPSTWYSIKLKSVNLFGGSKFSNSTGYKKTMDEKTVTFYQEEDAYVSGLRQKDEIIVSGQEVIYSIGEKSISASSGVYIDFDQPSYRTANPKTVKVSFGIIKKHPYGRIRINDRDMELSMTANSLAVDEVIMVEQSMQSDTEMQLSINKQLGARGDEIKIKLPRGYRVITNPFGIDLAMQSGTVKTRIESFKGTVGMLLKYAESKRSLYPGGIYIAYYDSAAKRIRIISDAAANSKAQTQITKPGEYVLIGKMTRM